MGKRENYLSVCGVEQQQPGPPARKVQRGESPHQPITTLSDNMGKIFGDIDKIGLSEDGANVAVGPACLGLRCFSDQMGLKAHAQGRSC